MRSPWMLAAVILPTMAMLLGADAASAQLPTAKCTAAKIKCATAKTTSLLGCQTRALGKGVAVDQACVATADAKFSNPATSEGCLERAEAKRPPCATTGDANAIGATVDAFVLDVVKTLDPSYPAPVLLECAARGEKCVSSQVKAVLACYGKNTTKPDATAFATCVQKAQDKFAGGSDPTTSCLGKVLAKGGCGVLPDPAALAVKTDGFAADVHGTLTLCGTLLTGWGSFGSGDGQFSGGDPAAVAVDGSGNVFVADTGNERIKEFDNAGNFLAAWGSSGSGDGQFAFDFENPPGIAVDASGNVFVPDYYNERIQKFSNTGTFLATWGSEGTGDGQFEGPLSVAVDASGNVFVVDQFNYRIQKFSDAGTFLAAWGSFGGGNGQFSDPHRIAVDASGNVFVTDRDRIQK